MCNTLSEQCSGDSASLTLSEALIKQENEISKEARRRANLTIEKLRLQVSALLNIDEELDVNNVGAGCRMVRIPILPAL